MNLKWTHTKEVFTDGISPKMGKHCDIGCIINPNSRKLCDVDLKGVDNDKTILKLDLEVEPNNKGALIPPGYYRAELKIAAANFEPVTITIEINHTGVWYDDENKMFSDGIGIKMV